jgi:O-antigen/teichoic acid export membrane protein
LTRQALIVLVLVTIFAKILQTPRLILTRQVNLQRLAVLRIVDAIVTTMVSISLAWGGVTLWALLATNIVSLLLNVLILQIWNPVWKPQIKWSIPHVSYYLKFGSQNFIAKLLSRLINRLDDLWVGYFLGDTALGFYSRAFTFASYPSTIIAAPIADVSKGTYANLKGQKEPLSKAFFRSNAFLLRVGFLVGGGMFIISPEFIQIILGDKWMPMLSTFRLMLVFMVLNPIKETISNLFTSIGLPSIPVKARFLQLFVFIGCLIPLGYRYGIDGVAVSVDVMIVVGIGYLLFRVQEFISISIRKLLFVPMLALSLSILMGYLISLVDFPTAILFGFIKIIIFSITFLSTLAVFEYSRIIRLVKYYVPNDFVLFRKPKR